MNTDDRISIAHSANVGSMLCHPVSPTPTAGVCGVLLVSPRLTTLSGLFLQLGFRVQRFGGSEALG